MVMVVRFVVVQAFVRLLVVEPRSPRPSVKRSSNWNAPTSSNKPQVHGMTLSQLLEDRCIGVPVADRRPSAAAMIVRVHEIGFREYHDVRVLQLLRHHLRGPHLAEDLLRIHHGDDAV